MRNYAMLAPFFWTRGSGKRLRGDPDAQVVAMYFSTSPSANLIGLYYLPLVNIVHETGLSMKRTRDAIARVEAAGYASYDFDAELVWIPNAAQFEIGAKMKGGDKRRGKVLAELKQIGRHRFVGEFMRAYGETYQLRLDLDDVAEGASAIADGASAIDGPVRSGSISDQGRFGFDESARPGGELGESGAASTTLPRRSHPPAGEPTSEAVVEWSRAWGVDNAHPRFAQFLHHHRARGVPLADWREAWSAWCAGAPNAAPPTRPRFGQPFDAGAVRETSDFATEITRGRTAG